MRPELEQTTAAAALAATAPALDRTATQPPGGTPLAATTSAGLAAGQQLGHFRVERPLGAGGMGEVYLATDLALDRPVAIKVLPAGLARDATRRDRLIREARAQARVVHPNVGHIYFIGEERELLFVAMEYVPGETLAQRAATGPMPIDDALAAIRGAALGLREAHRAGFLHRDVKPSNLMLDGHGVLKVLDFGLAAGGAPAEDDPSEQVSVTQTSLAGTPLYMAPEQARGEAIDARADIYALGATLFHIVSGRPPFEGGSAAELRELHSSAPRPRVPAATQPRTATAVGELCARMMAPRPADRFASYDELIAALDTMATSRARPAGFWVRTIATAIDLTAVALPIATLVALIAALTGLAINEGPVVLAAFALYQAGCTHRWGRTAGKALLELEVVHVDTGHKLGWVDAFRRALALTGPMFVTSCVTGAQELAGYKSMATSVFEMVVYLSLIIALAVASARSHGKRALWDRFGHALVRYRTAV